MCVYAMRRGQYIEMNVRKTQSIYEYMEKSKISSRAASIENVNSDFNFPPVSLIDRSRNRAVVPSRGQYIYYS
jgi:hypothetical protein